MTDNDVTNVVVVDVIRALIRVALNQKRNAIFIWSTAYCFILTVAIYSLFFMYPVDFAVILGDYIKNEYTVKAKFSTGKSERSLF